MKKKSVQPEQGEEEEDVAPDNLDPQAPRLTTPVSPSRRPSTHPRGFHTPTEGPPVQTPTLVEASMAGGHAHRDESLRAERGRSFTSSFSMSKQCLPRVLPLSNPTYLNPTRTLDIYHVCHR